MTLDEVSHLTEDQAREYMEHMRWPDGPACVHCGCTEVVALHGKATRPGVKKCYACGKQFTVTVGTIFEDSHIPLRKWLMALALMCQSKKGISAMQVMRHLGIKSYKTAWYMCHRIRFAMDSGPLSELLKGRIESDETYVGNRRPRKGTGYHKPGRGTDKPPVVALVEREGRLKAVAVPRVNAENLKRVISQHVDPDNSALITDELPSYGPIGRGFGLGHHTVNHSADEYSRDGWIHVNNCESYFALLKRGVMGAFHHVSREHLHRYCSEFEFRWNSRKVTDSERFRLALDACPGKRLHYKQPKPRCQ